MKIEEQKKRSNKLGYMTKCRYAAQYKAQKPPKCGCDMCWIKWRLNDLYTRTITESFPAYY